jgi:hypothetical protein
VRARLSSKGALAVIKRRAAFVERRFRGNDIQSLEI